MEGTSNGDRVKCAADGNRYQMELADDESRPKNRSLRLAAMRQTVVRRKIVTRLGLKQIFVNGRWVRRSGGCLGVQEGYVTSNSSFLGKVGAKIMDAPYIGTGLRFAAMSARRSIPVYGPRPRFHRRGFQR